MTNVHVNTARSAVTTILSERTEGDLKTGKVRKMVNKYGSKMGADKLALYNSLLNITESRRMKYLENLNGFADQREKPEKLRQMVFAMAKHRGIHWHRFGAWLFALTVKQLRQVGAVVRGEVPSEVRNGEKVDLVAYIAEGAVEGQDRPQKLGQVYANTLEVSEWDGLEDYESVEYQKSHSQKKTKAKKRNRTRREKKPTKKDDKSSKSQDSVAKKPTKAKDASSKLDDALNTIRELATGDSFSEGDVRGIIQDEIANGESRKTVESIVDDRVEEKMASVNLNLAFA